MGISLLEQIVVGHPAVPLAEHYLCPALVPKGWHGMKTFKDIQFVLLMSPPMRKATNPKGGGIFGGVSESIIDLIEAAELQKQILDRKDLSDFLQILFLGSLLADKV